MFYGHGQGLKIAQDIILHIPRYLRRFRVKKRVGLRGAGN